MFKLILSIGALFGLASAPVSSPAVSTAVTVSPLVTVQPRVLIQQKIDDLKDQLKVLELQLKLPSDIRAGSEGDSIDQLQQDLVLLGTLKKEEINGKRFGPRTENALKQFQTASGLEPNGKFDAATKSALAKALAALPGSFTPSLTNDIINGLDVIAGICPDTSKGPTPTVATPSPSSASTSPSLLPTPSSSVKVTASPTLSPTPTAQASPTATPKKKEKENEDRR